VVEVTAEAMTVVVIVAVVMAVVTLDVSRLHAQNEEQNGVARFNFRRSTRVQSWSSALACNSFLLAGAEKASGKAPLNCIVG
jgi:hypothetical protein